MEFYFILMIWLLVIRTNANPLQNLSYTSVVQNQTYSSTSKSNDPKPCARVILDSRDVHFLKNGNMFVPLYNTTIHPSKMFIVGKDRTICFHPTKTLIKDIFKYCGIFQYNPDEFKLLTNGSVILFNILLKDELYEINKAGQLVMCPMDYDDVDERDFINLYPKPMNDIDKASMYIGNIGSAISIVALLGHIVTFWLVPSMRTLPGYIMMSLSIAFLMAYSFSLIGQVPEVLGTFCVTTAILQQYFFLVAFFWMNIMAFDVWKTLRMATERLMVSTKKARRRQFVWYSFYAWLVPLCIVLITIGVDNSKNVPDKIKPLFGKNSICWFTNDIAKGIFFSLPAFILFLINAVFFILSAFILKNNTMQETDEYDHRQTAKFNFILYVRLAIMMGVTWLVGAIGVGLSNTDVESSSETVRLDTVVWFIFDILNSLQGLFVFLLFTCSRKVFRHLQIRFSLSTFRTETDKHTVGESTKWNRESTKCDSKKSDFYDKE